MTRDSISNITTRYYELLFTGRRITPVVNKCAEILAIACKIYRFLVLLCVCIGSRLNELNAAHLFNYNLSSH